MATLISSVCWIPRGFPAEFPKKQSLTEEEIRQISNATKEQISHAREEMTEDGFDAPRDLNDDLEEYNLEAYDDEEDIEQTGFLSGSKIAYFENPEDPYIVLDEKEEDKERAELQILPTDNILLSSKTEDDISNLEIYVYEDSAENLYVHHDILLPSMPLCLEWLYPEDGLNLVAVGTFEPGIEVWDVDTIDGYYPHTILGGSTKKKKKKANESYHVSAVLSLSANRNHRNLLASGSADQTVKLWDLRDSKCASSTSYHEDKVSAVQWHASDSTVLLSGGYDRQIIISDMRASAPSMKVSADGDIESISWDPHSPYHFFASTESGSVFYFDMRVKKDAQWKLEAHSGPVSSMSINPHIPGYLATGSVDKQTKLWNVKDSPSLVVSRDLGVGKVFTISWAPDAEVSWRLAVGGSEGSLQIWDTRTNAAVRDAFKIQDDEVQKERLVGLAEPVDSSSDEGEDDEGSDEEIDGQESMKE
ncbi:putative WD repeat-containing protein [Neolecta irregularis DAH-3]|uniref:Putative WD repeat-containing protein n=1 Tax=Neolecta irregularis (strain DAH-3) TaxID=1198029 RepID=A0A1U7LNF9_NEOID|nr:putative WD repeat-containing protein [Neolecta irregularis DAH-3]|eukprot:OLL24061.1 putative WD repeat-containing protein [Neolecta irregularis DAH-3]